MVDGGKGMAEYLVSWQIEVVADSPEEAAIEAYNMMPHPGSDSTATFLDVLDPNDESLIEQFDVNRLGR